MSLGVLFVSTSDFENQKNIILTDLILSKQAAINVEEYALVKSLYSDRLQQAAACCSDSHPSTTSLLSAKHNIDFKALVTFKSLVILCILLLFHLSSGALSLEISDII